MPETTVWRGTSSQWQNAGRYIWTIVLAVILIGIFLAARILAPLEIGKFSPFILLLLIVPIFMAVAAYLQTKSRIYELTTERIKTSKGVFSRVTDTLELYRVKDLETRQPFFGRLVGIENVQINTSDASSPVVWIAAVPSRVGLPDKIRNQVEAIRTQKGVREIDME